MSAKFSKRSSSSTNSSSSSNNSGTNNGELIVPAANATILSNTNCAGSAGSNVSESEYDISQPYYLMFLVNKERIAKLHPYAMLKKTELYLTGLADCIEKGPTQDVLPPADLKEGDDYYRWESWRDCTCILKKTAWTPSNFKDAAVKTYLSISQDYLNTALGQLDLPLLQ